MIGTIRCRTFWNGQGVSRPSLAQSGCEVPVAYHIVYEYTNTRHGDVCNLSCKQFSCEVRETETRKKILEQDTGKH